MHFQRRTQNSGHYVYDGTQNLIICVPIVKVNSSSTIIFDEININTMVFIT